MLFLQLAKAAFEHQRIAKGVKASAETGDLLPEKLLFLVAFRELRESRIAAKKFRELLVKLQFLSGKAPGMLALFLRGEDERLCLLPFCGIRRKTIRNILRYFHIILCKDFSEHAPRVGALARAENGYDAEHRKREKRQERSEPKLPPDKARGGKAAGGEQKQYPYPKPRLGSVCGALRPFRPALIGTGALRRGLIRFSAAKNPGAKRRFCRSCGALTPCGLVFGLLSLGASGFQTTLFLFPSLFLCSGKALPGIRRMKMRVFRRFLRPG